MAVRAFHEVIPEAFAVSRYPLLEFDRKPIDRFPLIGFPLSWTADLTLIHVLNTDIYRLNGYAVFRNSDVKRWRPIVETDFLARAARLQRLRPSKLDAVRISSLKEALGTAGAEYPLITVHLERLRRDVCYVGKFLRTSQRALTIRSLSPQAAWEGEERYSLKDITLLEFGGEYERLLQQIAQKLQPAALK